MNRLDFIQRAQIDQGTLEIWIGEEWLLPNRLLADLEFSEIDLARAALIVDLTQRLGVNDEGVGAILNLVDQVHGLRSMLSMLMPHALPLRLVEDEQLE
ncbi:hypothetical protein IHQ71_24325 [Rhizobium sp. TH2]|nr:hypothetical protein IHQ71_24325 [Rhizobium sp. TH2]